MNSVFKENVDGPCTNTDVRQPSPPISMPKVLLKMFIVIINMTNKINDITNMTWPKCD